MLFLGLDFGTESGRALLVDGENGSEVASAVHRYEHGVIDEVLPDSDVRLGREWALQHPDDWIAVLRHAVPEAMRLAGARPEDVAGIGVDFTACTPLPITREGEPLCRDDRWRLEPHAWPKLWKHHAAWEQAERITALADARGEPWLERYGGRISSEWMHSKVLQVLEEAPDVYAAADRFVEGGDWVVRAMTGSTLRNATAAGYKALWVKGLGYPDAAFLTALDVRMATLNETKLAGEVMPAGTYAGGLIPSMAEMMGVRAGTPVAVATIDAHAAVPGAGVAEPGRMVLIMGTSTCHMLIGSEMHLVPGISGVAEDGIVPGLFGYEAGQAGVGDIFEWFVANATPARYEAMAAERGISLYQLLEEEAAKLAPGESGLVALDWWNGNRSVLTDASLSGAIVGLTLGTRAHEIFRALVEATAFGTRIIIEAFESNGVPVDALIACGGLAERNKLMMQIYADVTGREFRRSGAAYASARGAALLGAVAAGADHGGYASIADAARAIGAVDEVVYTPITPHRAIYAQLFEEYRTLHDYFGRGGNDVMRRIKDGGRRTEDGGKEKRK